MKLAFLPCQPHSKNFVCQREVKLPSTINKFRESSSLQPDAITERICPWFCKSRMKVTLIKKYQIKYLNVFRYHNLRLIIETLKVCLEKTASFCEQWINTKMKYLKLVYKIPQCRVNKLIKPDKFLDPLRREYAACKEANPQQHHITVKVNFSIPCVARPR
jgi:hypothetical protein